VESGRRKGKCLSGRENEKLPNVNELWDGETLPKLLFKGRIWEVGKIPKDFLKKFSQSFVYSQVDVKD
jgi:hypothetical protein